MFSDVVKQTLGYDNLVPEEGSLDYFKALAHRDRFIRGTLLGDVLHVVTEDEDLTPIKANITLGIRFRDKGYTDQAETPFVSVEPSQVDDTRENFMLGYRVVFDRERMILGWKRSNCFEDESLLTANTPPPEIEAPSPPTISSPQPRSPPPSPPPIPLVSAARPPPIDPRVSSLKVLLAQTVQPVSSLSRTNSYLSYLFWPSSEFTKAFCFLLCWFDNLMFI
ncbi:unnamed protein product [Cochlearia groenlandica]